MRSKALSRLEAGERAGREPSRLLVGKPDRPISRGKDLTPGRTSSMRNYLKQKPLEWKLVASMGALLAASLVSLFVASVFAAQARRDAEELLRTTAERGLLIRRIQVSFRLQVQEWKNVLLRGHDPVLRQRYVQGFRASQADVSRALARLKQMDSAKLVPEMLKRLEDSHAAINAEYESGFAELARGGWTNFRAVDDHARGLDRPFDALVERLVHETEAFEREAREQAGILTNARMLLVGVILGLTQALLILATTRVAVRLLRRARAAEQEADRSREDLRITLESIGDGVIATDRVGLVVRMNPVAEQLTGWPIAEARGRPLTEVFRIVEAHTGRPAELPVARVIATGKVVGLANHTVLISRNNTRYHIADSGAPIRDAQDEVVGVVLVFRDVTREYSLQQQLVHSQKLDAIGRLAGGVAHDFNNVITVIISAAEMLGRKARDAETLSFQRMILESARRAGGLVDKLLSFARRQPASSTKVDLHRVLEETVGMLQSTIDRRVAIDYLPCSGPAIVVGDPSQLQSVFLNLGINAWHAMEEAGRITIETELVELEEAAVEGSPFALTAGAYVRVSVRDTGVGIPPEHLAKVFDPFFTTKDAGSGTGLGLAAAYGTIQQHRGSITVESEPGKGTVFQIHLPLTHEELGAHHGVANIRRGSGRILVVDDEDSIRATARLILLDLGYEVELAADGEEAVALVSRDPQRFDLVLLDMIMPNMNGRECFHALRSIRPDVAVILTSGFTREGDLAQLKAAGLRGFVRKPYVTATLSEAVHTALLGR